MTQVSQAKKEINCELHNLIPIKTEATYRILISGGGTGGHIYPALAIANAWMDKHPDSEILFVGAEGKMEMQKVPEAGYPIKGLPVAGLQRKFTLANLSFPIKLWRSLRLAAAIVNEFNPQLVVGVGGYASGPVLYAAQKKGIPTLLQEQNSYAGLTNKLLAKKARKICVAYPEMDRFFPKEKLHVTGNPVRKDLLDLDGKRKQGIQFFGLDPNRKTVLVLGGSLGARTLNLAMLQHMADLEGEGYQVLWQSGKFYFKDMEMALRKTELVHIHLTEFIREMDLAYAAADLIVSRAGALSVSELCLVGKPVIFIPSPNVAEDHQTKNATACVKQRAAVLLADVEAVVKFKAYIDDLLQQEEKAKALAENIKKLAMPDAANALVRELELLLT